MNHARASKRRLVDSLTGVRLATLLILAGLAPGLAAAGTDTGIAVIAGRGQAETAPLPPALVAGIFARKRQLWHDRSAILPVNLPASHPLRRNFSRWVFGRTPEEMQDYWNDQYFHGVIPPPVLASEEAVLRFVSSTPGAVGYVSVCLVDSRVAVLAIVQPPEGAAACPH